MRLSIFVLSLLLLLSGCGSSPDVPLAPKLDKYAVAQQQCHDFIDGKKVLSGPVEKECDQFLQRLEIANATADELQNKKMMKGEYAQTKIRYSRERNRLKHQYETLSEAVEEATLAAIKRDDADTFALGVAFPGNTFQAPYYDYMKAKAPRFDNNSDYIAYRLEKSEKLMRKAQHYLKEGHKRKALSLFEKAAEMGNAEAARSTGLLYEEFNTELALKWHLRAVEGGVKASYFNLGRLYEEKGEDEEALKWYHKAAEEEDVAAQFKLYQYNADIDQKQAVSWLKRAASNDYPKAQYTYALILINEGQADKGVALLLQASKQGYTKASDYLGSYYYGLGLYERAFMQLDKSDSANSFYLRAKMLEEGKGGYKDYAQAHTFYSRAAAMGKKDVKADLTRVSALLNKEQQRLAKEEEKLRIAEMKKMVKECGEIPDKKNVKKKNQRLHITGTASAPVGKQSYIIYGDDGEEYFLQQAKGIHEDEHVDISVKATGRSAILNPNEDSRREINQFTFIKSCVVDEDD